MIDVIPLKFGPSFKKIFGHPAIFSQFASDVLGIPIKIDQVHTEYEYPEPVGFVRSQYDLFAEDVEQRIIIEIQNVKEEDFFDRFLYYHLISLVEQVKGYKEYCFDRTIYTIVLLTSIPRDNSVNFSYAISDWNPVDEYGRRLEVYPHLLIFLAPRLVNERTPHKIRQWLRFIEDSLDGKMNEGDYPENPFQEMMEEMKRFRTNPKDLASIKDEAAWEKAKKRFAAEGRVEGRAAGLEEGRMGQAQVLLRLLERRFHPIPDDVCVKVYAAGFTTLEIWIERILDAKTLDSIFE